MPGKRNNAYYIQRLKKDWPVLYREVQDGLMNVAEARRRAGLGGHRTRLHELKNAWMKATPAEQAYFLSWASLVAPAMAKAPVVATATPFGTAWDTDGSLLGWARRRIPEIMTRRRLSFGDLADELGIKRLNASVAGALHGTRVRSPSTALAVDAWLKANAAI